MCRCVPVSYTHLLSNAEQHFLGYKSIAAIESGFKKAIQKGTAILDIGGGNLQISLFDKDALVLTPVSYTHLDVYKRQGRQSDSC